MKVIRGYSLLILILVTIMGCGSSSPAPNTEDSLNKLATASTKVGQPVVPGGISKEEGIKVWVDWVRKIYSKAGFSFDATVIQLSGDLEKNSKFLESPSMLKTPAFFTYTQVMMFANVEQESGIKIDQYVSQKTADAMHNIIAIIKRQEEAKKQEGILREQQQKEQIKQEAINAIPGVYRTGSRRYSVGEHRTAINIKLLDDKKDIVFSSSNSKEDMCVFENKTAHLSYAGQFGVYELFEATFEEGDCKMLMKFFGDSLEIEQANKCSAYCKKNGSMGNTYQKEPKE